MRRLIETITRAEAAASRREGLRQRLCVINYQGEYWRARGEGYTSDFDQAGEYEVQYAIDHCTNETNLGLIETIPDDPTKPPRLRDLPTVLGFSIRELLKASPENQTVLAMVMSKVGRMPPAEATTFEQIEEWIEMTPDLMLGAKKAVPVAVRTPAPPPAATIIVPITLMQKIHGRCRYSADRDARSTVHFSEAEIREWLEQDMSLSEIMHAMGEKITNDAYEYEEDGSAEESNYDYENYEIISFDGSDHEYDANQMQTQLNELLRRIATDEQRTRLGL